jgi:hypothetical protein
MEEARVGEVTVNVIKEVKMGIFTSIKNLHVTIVQGIR